MFTAKSYAFPCIMIGNYNLFCRIPMAQSKDPVLLQMRAAATSKHVCNDLPAQLALLSSLEYWSRRDDDPALRNNFIQIFFVEANFGLSYEKLVDICHYSEKAIRIHCKKYADYFIAEYTYFGSLSLPFQVTRYIEYTQNERICKILGTHRKFSLNDLSRLIAAPPASEERELCAQIFHYFLNHGLEKAI